MGAGTIIERVLSEGVSYYSGYGNKSSQYRDPDNQGLGFFFDYRELFLDLMILIIKDLLLFIIFRIIAEK